MCVLHSILVLIACMYSIFVLFSCDPFLLYHPLHHYIITCLYCIITCYHYLLVMLDSGSGMPYCYPFEVFLPRWCWTADDSDAFNDDSDVYHQIVDAIMMSDVS